MRCFLCAYRPLAGCGLFRNKHLLRSRVAAVSVPLRGVGCFGKISHKTIGTVVNVLAKKRNENLVKLKCNYFTTFQQTFQEYFVKNRKIFCAKR